MSNSVDISLLQQYLTGEITKDAVLHLDGSPVSEEQLESAIAEFDEVALHIEGAALKTHLQGLHRTIDSKERKTVPQRWLAIAASIILIAAFSTLIWQGGKRAPSFDDYFDHFDQLVTFRNSDSTSYSEGLEAYARRNYQKAYEEFSGIDDLDNELKFYEAVSALGSGKFDSAVVVFEELGTNTAYKYYQQVRWYLGLAYWKTDKLDQARTLWSTISENQFKYKAAQELIKELGD